VIYRTDQYKAAGIKSTPKSLAQFIADGRKLMKKYGKDSGYSACTSREVLVLRHVPSSTTTVRRSPFARAVSEGRG
jgi:hypothetical protein